MVTSVAPAAGLHTPFADPLAGVSIGVGGCLRSSVVPASPETPIPPLMKVAVDVGDRLDDATWIGRVSPGFSFTTDTVPGRPGLAASAGASVRPPAAEGEPHFSLFRFEVRVGDRVRFRLRAGTAGAGLAHVPRTASMRLFDARGLKLKEGQCPDAELPLTAHGPADSKLKYTFHEPGVYHLGVWTGRPGAAETAAGAGCLLRVSYAGLDLPDLVATAVIWDKDTHGLRVEYEVTDENHPRPRPAGWGPGVALYWVDWGCRRLGRIRHTVIDRHNADTRLTPGPHTLLVPRAAFPKPPSAATGVEFCLNGDRAVPERDPTNNVKFTGLSLGRKRSRPRAASFVASFDID